MSKLENGSADLDQLESEFLELLNAVSDPSSSTLSTDQLAKKLGIDGLPTRDEALKLLEDEILAPVRDLSGPELSRWQMYVYLEALCPFPPQVHALTW